MKIIILTLAITVLLSSNSYCQSSFSLGLYNSNVNLSYFEKKLKDNSTQKIIYPLKWNINISIYNLGVDRYKSIKNGKLNKYNRFTITALELWEYLAQEIDENTSYGYGNYKLFSEIIYDQFIFVNNIISPHVGLGIGFTEGYSHFFSGDDHQYGFNITLRAGIEFNIKIGNDASIGINPIIGYKDFILKFGKYGEDNFNRVKSFYYGFNTSLILE